MIIKRKNNWQGITPAHFLNFHNIQGVHNLMNN